MKTVSISDTRNIQGGSNVCYKGYILSRCNGKTYTTCQVCGKRYYGFGCVSSMLWHCIFSGHMR